MYTKVYYDPIKEEHIIILEFTESDLNSGRNPYGFGLDAYWMSDVEKKLDEIRVNLSLLRRKDD